MPLNHARSLSDHPGCWDFMYGEILHTAETLPPEALFCEIGTRNGGTALLALIAIKESNVNRTMLTIDPYGNKLYRTTNHNEYPDTFYRTAMKELSSFCYNYNLNHIHYKMTSDEFIHGVDSRVIHIWSSDVIVPNYPVYPFSFGYVYLDGEHVPEIVSRELSWFVPRLVKNGLLVIDDIHYINDSELPYIRPVLELSTVIDDRSFYRKSF